MDPQDDSVSPDEICLECEQPATYRCWVGTRPPRQGRGVWMYFCTKDHATCCEELK